MAQIKQPMRGQNGKDHADNESAENGIDQAANESVDNDVAEGAKQDQEIGRSSSQRGLRYWRGCNSQHRYPFLVS